METGMEKHALSGDHYMANDQMEGVFAQAIDLDWIQDIILDKTGKIVLYRAIETDFDTINSTLADLKQQTKKTLKKYQQNEEKDSCRKLENA
jgi:hypothetical protein